MCRYAFKNYKPHYACFECRKVFRKVTIEDYFKQRGELHMYLDFRNKSHLKKMARELAEKYGTSYQELSAKYHSYIRGCFGKNEKSFSENEKDSLKNQLKVRSHRT